MKNPNGPSIEDVDDWNDARRDEERIASERDYFKREAHANAERLAATRADLEKTESLLSNANRRVRERGVANETLQSLLRTEGEVRLHWESKYAKEAMLHGVTKFELEEARNLLREFKVAAHYLHSWIAHTVPTWTPEVQEGLDELKSVCDKAEGRIQS